MDQRFRRFLYEDWPRWERWTLFDRWIVDWRWNRFWTWRQFCSWTLHQPSHHWMLRIGPVMIMSNIHRVDSGGSTTQTKPIR